jgi:hypothetical protein
MYIEDFIVSLRTGWRMIFGIRGTQFSSTVSQSAVVYVRKRCQVSRRTGLLGWFLGLTVLVFVNGFWASSSLCTLKISASGVELGFKDDFWDTRDSVFINGFSVTISLCAQMISASAVELGFLDDFCVPGSLFSLTVSDPAVVYVHWKFQRQ